MCFRLDDEAEEMLFAMLAVVYFIGLEAVHGAKERDQEATVPLHGFVYLSLTTDGYSREERRW